MYNYLLEISCNYDILIENSWYYNLISINKDYKAKTSIFKYATWYNVEILPPKELLN